DTCFHLWTKRDVAKMREHAYAWRDATTSVQRDKIFTDHGVRWSELWRLPYWNPTRMLVIDSMHCILLGLVYYHCCYVLGIDLKKAKHQDTPPPAFYHDWVAYHAGVPKMYHLLRDHKRKHVMEIQNALILPLEGEKLIDETMLRKKLASKNLQPLMFISYTLGLTMYTIQVNGHPKLVPAWGKAQFINLLVQWQMEKPLASEEDHTVIDVAALHHIQSAIRDTVTPSWISTVPSNYGEASAGSIKADKWHVLSTVFLPIALVTLWGDDEQAQSETSHRQKLLDHTMALFQA
ncbi:hypothetical protein EDD85DRAFT_751525, partial [Armillaria nabsnona]